MLKIQCRVLFQRRLVMAGKPVAGENYLKEYFKIEGLLFEIKSQLRHPGGYTGDIEVLQRHLQLAIERKFVKPLFKRDMTKERGWKLENEGPEHPGLAIAEMKLLTYDEDEITGAEYEERAKKLNVVFGQHTAEYLLEHQIEIPREWRKFSLLFPGTVWRDFDGSSHVPRLGWDDIEWRYFYWLSGAYEFHPSDRLLVPLA